MNKGLSSHISEGLSSHISEDLSSHISVSLLISKYLMYKDGLTTRVP